MLHRFLFIYYFIFYFWGQGYRAVFNEIQKVVDQKHVRRVAQQMPLSTIAHHTAISEVKSAHRCHRLLRHTDWVLCAVEEGRQATICFCALLFFRLGH